MNNGEIKSKRVIHDKDTMSYYCAIGWRYEIKRDENGVFIIPLSAPNRNSIWDMPYPAHDTMLYDKVLTLSLADIDTLVHKRIA